MKITPASIPDILIFEPMVHGDQRGYFKETFRQRWFEERGLAYNFVQDNVSRSGQGVLRGLHYQCQHAQGKLIRVTHGEVFDVAVDVRLNSPTFGQHVATTLSADNHRQLFIPPGFAHGFCVLSEYADFAYKCTDYYHPSSDRGIAWNDPALNIEWPLTTPMLSAKDQDYPRLADVDPSELP